MVEVASMLRTGPRLSIDERSPCDVRQVSPRALQAVMFKEGAVYVATCPTFEGTHSNVCLAVPGCTDALDPFVISLPFVLRLPGGALD